MSDLDVIREARDYLAGLIEKSEIYDPAPWKAEVYRSGQAEVLSVKGFSVTEDDGSIMPDTASLIAALRAAAPHIVGALDSWLDRIADFRDAVEPIIETHDETFKAPTEALALARAILATKGQLL